MPNDTKLEQIIDMLWVHPESAEWTPKIDKIPGAAFREWITSDDIEILGFAYSMLDDHRLTVEPALSLDEYLKFVRHYYERCFLENPDNEWSDSRYSAGWDLVNVLAFQWESADVPKSVLENWKQWLADIYKRGSDDVRTCIVTATLEHLLERASFVSFLLIGSRTRF